MISLAEHVFKMARHQSRGFYKLDNLPRTRRRILPCVDAYVDVPTAKLCAGVSVPVDEPLALPKHGSIFSASIRRVSHFGKVAGSKALPAHRERYFSFSELKPTIDVPRSGSIMVADHDCLASSQA